MVLFGWRRACALVALVRAARALSLVRRGELRIFSTRGCPYCMGAKEALKKEKVAFTNIDLGEDPAKRVELAELVGTGFTVPQIFVGETKVGGSDALAAAIADGSFARLVDEEGIAAAEVGVAAEGEQTFDVLSLRVPGAPLNVLDDARVASLVGENGCDDDDSDADVARDLQRRCLDLLDAHVTAEGVDYAGLRTSAAMGRFVVATRRLTALDDDACAALGDAFWINVYNALVMHAQVAVGMGATPEARSAFFGGATGAKYRVGPYDLSPDDIEHAILRRSPPGDARSFAADDPRRRVFLQRSPLDPRIHFALNCGAKSCPPVKLFSADGLDAELALAAAAFVTSTTTVDAAAGTVELSKLLLWYGVDFAADDDARLARLAAFVPETPLATDLQNARGFRIVHSPYDWGRNDLPAAPKEDEDRLSQQQECT